MPTTAKKTPKTAAKETAVAEPSLRFRHSQELQERTQALLDALEKAADPEDHRDDLSDLVVDLTGVGMDYYFMKPLEQAKVGFVVEQSARLGLSGAVKVIGSVTRKIIGRMNGPQLLVVTAHIRHLAA